MGRHATVAGRQAASSAQRSKVFTKLMREVMVAAKLGGADPTTNPRLRLAIDKARAQNMPKDNVERAIKKGTGDLEGVSYEEITYEAYGPCGTAFLMEVLTDNRNRTNPELKRVLQKNGGTFAEMNSVAWMFKRKGVIDIGVGVDEDRVMDVALEAGADDVINEGGSITVYADLASFTAVRDAITAAPIAVERAGLEMIPENTIKVSGEDAKTVLGLIAALEDHDDVQNVYHNADISEQDLAKYLPG